MFLCCCYRSVAAVPSTAAHPGLANGGRVVRAAHATARGRHPLDVQGEPACPGGGRPAALRGALRLPGRRREPALAQER